MKETATKIVKRLVDAGHVAYFAGGWVRDYLMDHPSDDIDIATDAPLEEVKSLFEKTILVGEQFGIVIVVEEGHQFEVATFRTEKGYEDGRRPTHIETTTPENDAKRRDFTINGMFYDPLRKKLYDFVDGQKDLKAKVLRAIGNPHERFYEDRLRMIRAVRYSARFHFPIEAETLEAIKRHSAELFPSVAIERVWQEFEKMAKFPNFDIALLMLFDLGLLQVIFPNHSRERHELEKHLIDLPAFPANAPLIAKILELFPEYSAPEALNLCDHFKLSNADRKFISIYFKAKVLFPNAEVEPYELVQLYADPHYPMCLKLLSINNLKLEELHKNQFSKLTSHIQRTKQHEPILRAKHLIEKGLKPGPEMGNLLKRAERLAINENITNADTLLDRLFTKS